MGPLEIIYGWQALLCAAACYGLTKLVSTILDLTMGEEKRKANRWLSKVAMPVTPVVLGALWATLVPLRPDVIVEYAAAHLDGLWVTVAYAGWGGACGQFATMLHQKLLDFVKHARPQGG